MSGRTFNPNVISEFAKFEDNILTAEHRAQAQKELRETPETRKENLQLLQDMLKGESNLNAVTDESFLLRFLRAKKFDVDKAFDQIKGYYAQRQKYPEVFADYLPSTVSVPLGNNLINFLPYRNFDGSAILVVKYGRWDPHAVPFEVFLRVTIMCIEWALENPVTQVCGLTVIQDMEGLNMNHIMHLTPSRIYCYVTSFQDTFPCRYKAVHVVNEPKIFSLAYEIGKPFLTEKLKSRIMFHGNNRKSLYRHVPPAILTEEFGGKLGPFDNNRMCKSILQGEEKYFDKLKFGYSKPPLRITQKHVS